MFTLTLTHVARQNALERLLGALENELSEGDRMESAKAAKSPYFDHDAERHTVGILLSEPRTQAALDELKPEHFHDQDAAAVIRAMKALKAARHGIDAVTLNDQLSASAENGNAMEYAVDAMGDWVPPSQIREYIEILKKCFMRRQLRILAGNVAYGSSDASQDPKALLTTMRSSLADLAETEQPQDEKRDGSAEAVAIRAYEELQKQMAGMYKPIKTGFDEFDKMTGGLFAGEVLVIGARPGTGKTAFSLELCRRFSDSGKIGLFASLEMSDTQLANRLIAAYGNIDQMKLRQAESMTENDWEAVGDGYVRMCMQKLWVSERVRTVDQLRDEILKAREKYGGLDYAIVDYIQLMSGGKWTENRNQEVGRISRELKMLAVEQKIVLVVLSQLNRESADRPTINQLRESGQIEQDADMIMLMYSPKRQDDVRPQELVPMWQVINNAGDRLIECILAKARNGMNGVTLLRFRPRYMQYEPIQGV